jgi:beta-aspartyl-peptidase (threonine type)
MGGSGLKLLGVLLLGLLVGGGGTTFFLLRSPSAGDTDSQVRAVLSRQQEAWNAGDLEGFMTDYWDSEDLTFFSGGKVEKGHAALLARYRKRYQSEGKEMGTLTFSELDITPMGPSDALARGRWKVVTSKDTFEGYFALSLYRFADEWKIAHDHTSQSEKKP